MPWAGKRSNADQAKRALDGKDFRLADEIDYIQRRAAEHDGRLSRSGL